MEWLIRLGMLVFALMLLFMGASTQSHEPVAGAQDLRDTAWLYYAAIALPVAGLVWSFWPESDASRNRAEKAEAQRRRRFEMEREGRERATAERLERIAQHRREIRKRDGSL